MLPPSRRPVVVRAEFRDTAGLDNSIIIALNVDRRLWEPALPPDCNIICTYLFITVLLYIFIHIIIMIIIICYKRYCEPLRTSFHIGSHAGTSHCLQKNVRPNETLKKKFRTYIAPIFLWSNRGSCLRIQTMPPIARVPYNIQKCVYLFM